MGIAHFHAHAVREPHPGFRTMALARLAPTAGLDRRTLDRLGDGLQELHAEVLKEPLPQELLVLLARLARVVD